MLVPARFAYLALAIGCGLSTSFEMLLVLRFIHGLVSAALGYWVFRRLAPHFEDFL